MPQAKTRRKSTRKIASAPKNVDMGSSAAREQRAVALKADSGPSRREKNTPTTAVPQIARTTFNLLPFSKNPASLASRNVAASQGKRGLRVPSEYQGNHDPSMFFDIAT